MDTRYSDVGHNNWLKKGRATEDMMGRHVQRSSRRSVVTNSQKPGRLGYTHTASVKATSLGIAHLGAEHPNSRWFHQEPVAVMGLVGLVYLFMHLYYCNFGNETNGMQA